jgi:hypothetical protein
MKLTTLIVLLYCILFTACKKHDSTNSTNKTYSNPHPINTPYDISSLFYNNSKIDSWSYGIAVFPGNKTVFDYSFKINTGTETFSNTIEFEVDSNTTIFRYSDSVLKTHNAYHIYRSENDHARSMNAPKIDKGVITGEKLTDSTWTINIDITFSDYYGGPGLPSLKDSLIFKRYHQ